MTPLVVDASVAIKWFLREDLSLAARKLAKSGQEFIAPDFIFAEAGNVITKHWRNKLLSDAKARIAIRLAYNMIVTTYPSRELLVLAAQIARGCSRSLYDSLYVALAVTQETYCVTADKRLVNSLSNTPYASFVQYLGDI